MYDRLFILPAFGKKNLSTQLKSKEKSPFVPHQPIKRSRIVPLEPGKRNPFVRLELTKRNRIIQLNMFELLDQSFGPDQSVVNFLFAPLCQVELNFLSTQQSQFVLRCHIRKL